MNPTVIRRTIIANQRRYGYSLEEAANELIHGFGVTDTTAVDQVVAEIREEAHRYQVLDDPPAVYDHEHVDLVGEASWYTGPEKGDEYWPRLKQRLESSSLADVVDEIDAASTKVVAHFGDPGIKRMKKKGLVVGYVQSGKTANYTAVIAKAADVRFRLFIVLSGMHNNLRRQTQIRIRRDLETETWGQLTTDEADFGTVVNGAALLLSERPSVAVVKKNASRLKRLRDWLRNIDPEVRARCPILLLDDEADQATPNSSAARGEMSRINELLREIWAEIPTGSYVGYTATPFANVFMDPNDDEELYPSDFILDLPRPPAYFGAERLFGRAELPDADAPDEPLDMIRTVAEEEADSLKPPRGKEAREEFVPDLPESLRSAIQWFALASATRRARGQGKKHSSMLIHTTAFVAPHFAMQESVSEYVQELGAQVDQGDLEELRELYAAERDRADSVRTTGATLWEEVEVHLPQVLSDIRVVVDNGISTDRLDYERVDDEGEGVVETVIAVGGGTLSRGLTLEGLVVSYFTRSASTYDTLLQMGRWFGYRPGYEDLPRIWMPEDLRRDFEFLALVEEEIRLDMRRLEAKQVTPKQFGIRVRAHPGRLAITSVGKMFHSGLVQVTFAGQRHQTFIFHEEDADTLNRNISAAQRLGRAAAAHGERGLSSDSRHQFFNVPLDSIIEFLSAYEFHPDQPGLQGEHVVGWINQCASNAPWNVVFVGSSRTAKRPDGTVVDLESLDLGVGASLPMVNRAPLASSEPGTANIKALLSQHDWVADADPDLVKETRFSGERYSELRSRMGLGATGLLVIYPVSHRSEPLRESAQHSRRKSSAPLPQIGVGIVFPETEGSLAATDADYYAVQPDWGSVADEEFDDVPLRDLEGDAHVDGQQVSTR